MYGDPPRTHGFLRASSGTIATFDVPGSVATAPVSINPAGAIIGHYFTGAGFVQHAFLRAPDGTFTTIDVAGDDSTSVHDINPAGAVTGFYNDANFVGHGFVRASNGAITTFDPPGSSNTNPTDINPVGEIIGAFFDGSPQPRGFLRAKHGTITTLECPSAAVQTTPARRSRAAAIARYYRHAMRFHGRAIGSAFGPFQASAASVDANPSGINPAGVITGSCAFHGFVRASNATFTIFDPPGSTLTSAVAINPAGAIAGYYFGAASFVAHGFLRIP